MAQKSSKSPQTIDETSLEDETQAIHIVDGEGYPVLTFDADEYRDYVEDMNLTREQEDELLQVLWWIIVQFVDLGFGIEPVQRALFDAPTNSANATSKEERL